MTEANIQVDLIKTEDQVKASRRIREIVFIVEQEVDPEIEYDEYEQSSTHILASLNGQAVGTARWRRTPDGFKLERFAVLKEARGNQVGSAMVRFILKKLEPGIQVYLNSQMVALKFYEKLGFTAQGPVFYEADIPHRKMVLEVDHSPGED